MIDSHWLPRQHLCWRCTAFWKAPAPYCVWRTALWSCHVAWGGPWVWIWPVHSSLYSAASWAARPALSETTAEPNGGREGLNEQGNISPQRKGSDAGPKQGCSTHRGHQSAQSLWEHANQLSSHFVLLLFNHKKHVSTSLILIFHHLKENKKTFIVIVFNHQRIYS